MRARTYIHIILPLKLEWIPTYSTREDIQIGDKVRVIFAGKEYIGVVEQVLEKAPDGLPESKIRDIISIESSLARVNEKEIKFWKQIAAYYMCTVGEVFKTACPASKFTREEIEARKARRAQEQEQQRLDKAERQRKKIEERIGKLQVKIEHARQESTRQKYSAELEELLKKGMHCETESEETTLTDNGDQLKWPTDNISLSDAQQQAMDQVKKAFLSHKPVLLDGVTGSGKTEIYAKLAGEVLKSGRNVLYLVPEIALSRQLEDRLKTFFADSLLVFHSHESISKRGQVASAIAAFGAKATSDEPEVTPYIVLGTRSALFLPHHDLGLIVVDEEHDSSYKQDSPAPRYNGRDVATMLALLQNANIILGSATPSLESEYNSETGRYERVRLEERYHGGNAAPVEIIDTKAERRKRGMHGSFSRKLIQHINDTIAQRGQVLILRGRRSYSPVIQCKECGDIPKCPRCNVSMSLHKGAAGTTEHLVCHHCGYTSRYEGICKKCGGTMEGIGAGTQKIEEEARVLFPNAEIARLDSDVARNPKEEASIIRNFSEGRTDILIGTQLVSKGFDFERLKLVAVIQPDGMLAVQDFRADEKAFQLLEQVRGRCARRGEDGLFVIQTAIPEHPVYSRFTGSEFTRNLLKERRDFGYPPFYRILNIYVRDNYEKRAEQMSTALCNCIYMILGNLCGSLKRSSGDSETVAITGPYTPAKEIEDGRHIRTIRVSLPRNKALQVTKDSIRRCIIIFETDNHYDGHISIDVDPM